jgi:excisionase family DNA binding protein
MTTDRLALSIEEAAERIGVSADLVRNLATAGTIPSAKVGRRRVIPVAGLEAFIEAQTTVGGVERAAF